MKTIRIKVLLIEAWSSPKEWLLEIPAMPREEAADTIFGISNMPDHIMPEWMQAILTKFPRTGLRSVSVGDALLIQDATHPEITHFAYVAEVGFKFHTFQV